MSRNKKRKRIFKIGNLLRLNGMDFLRGPKVYVVIMTYVLVAEQYFFPMLALSKEIDEYMQIYEPFVNFCNSKAESVLLSLVFMVMFCDFPKTNAQYTFTVMRAGRRNWLFANIIFAACAALLYLFGMFLISVLICQSRCFLLDGWSLYTRKTRFYYLSQLQEAGERLVVPPEIYMHYRPLQAFAVTILMHVLMAVGMACIFLLCNVCQKKNGGLLLNFLLLASGWVTYLFQMNGMWIFPYANSKIGWRNLFMLKETVVSDGYSVAYFLILILIAGVILDRLVRKAPISVSDHT